MNVYVNNKLHAVSEETTVTALLELIQPGLQKGVAVAVDNQVVPKAEWDQYRLQADCKITLIKAAQGG